MASSTESVLESLSNDLAVAVSRAAGAVVTIRGRRRFPSAGVLWRRGVVVTANHTVRREEEITATLPSSAEVSATLAGRDPTTDLASIFNKLDASGRTEAVTLGIRAGLILL